jgi:hypothetical protein
VLPLKSSPDEAVERARRDASNAVGDASGDLAAEQRPDLFRGRSPAGTEADDLDLATCSISSASRVEDRLYDAEGLRAAAGADATRRRYRSRRYLDDEDVVPEPCLDRFCNQVNVHCSVPPLVTQSDRLLDERARRSPRRDPPVVSRFSTIVYCQSRRYTLSVPSCRRVARTRREPPKRST